MSESGSARANGSERGREKDWLAGKLAELTAAAVAVAGSVGGVGSVAVVIVPADGSAPPVVLTARPPDKPPARRISRRPPSRLSPPAGVGE
jgi:hypothetical protein